MEANELYIISDLKESIQHFYRHDYQLLQFEYQCFSLLLYQEPLLRAFPTVTAAQVSTLTTGRPAKWGTLGVRKLHSSHALAHAVRGAFSHLVNTRDSGKH